MQKLGVCVWGGGGGGRRGGGEGEVRRLAKWKICKNRREVGWSLSEIRVWRGCQPIKGRPESFNFYRSPPNLNGESTF